MANKIIIKKGDPYGYLVMVRRVSSNEHEFKCMVRGCDKTTTQKTGAVTNGHVKSCGCLRYSKDPGPTPKSKNDEYINYLAFHAPWVA